MNKNAEYCSKYRNEISTKYVKWTKKGRSLKGSTLNIATKRSTKKKREKTERERDSLRKESWNRQINLNQYQPEKKL